MLKEKKGRISWFPGTMPVQAVFLSEQRYGMEKVCDKRKGDPRQRL